jgi:hypothetical protein
MKKPLWIPTQSQSLRLRLEWINTNTPNQRKVPLTPPLPIIPPAHRLFSLFDPPSITYAHPSLPAINEFCGDTISIPKPPNTTRITCKNHHHISINPSENQVQQICRDQRRQESDVHAVQSHKLDHNQFIVRDSFNIAARQIHHKYKLEIGSSDTRTVTTYKAGDTVLIAQGNITGRVRAHDSDPHGRWSYMTLNGTAGAITMIISAYQVCTKPTNAQGITAYHQQNLPFIANTDRT